MDGENNGSNPMNKWMILGGFPHYFWFNTHMMKLVNQATYKERVVGLPESIFCVELARLLMLGT